MRDNIIRQAGIRKQDILFAVIRNMSMTVKLIMLNVLIFFLVSIFLGFYPGMMDNLALVPEKIVMFQNLWTLLTSMFMHGGIAHLFFNMFSLYFVGSFVERLIGRKRFLYFYLASGLFAGLFFAVLSGVLGFGIWEGVFGNPSVGGVGASGAIFGLVGLLAVLTPKNRVYLIAGPLIAIVIQSVLGLLFPELGILAVLDFIISAYIFVSIFSMFSFNPRNRKLAVPIEMPFWIVPLVAIVPLVVIGLFVNLPIGNMAHLGGLILGAGYGAYLRRKYKKKVQLLNRMIR